MNITEKIKTFEDACLSLGIDPAKALPYANPEVSDQIAINAFAKITIIAKALNEGWVPDWDDSDQNKYYPWFWMESKAAGGSGFSCSGCDYGDSYSAVGSRLVFKSSELARYAGNHILETYLSLIHI